MRGVAIGQLEDGLADRVPRIAQTEARCHGAVCPNEAAAKVLEVDRVGHGAEEAVEEITLVEERILGGFEAAHVDESEDHAVDTPLRAIGQ